MPIHLHLLHFLPTSQPPPKKKNRTNCLEISSLETLPVLKFSSVAASQIEKASARQRSGCSVTYKGLCRHGIIFSQRQRDSLIIDRNWSNSQRSPENMLASTAKPRSKRWKRKLHPSTTSTNSSKWLVFKNVLRKTKTKQT